MFYHLPKIHKKNSPLRPFVSSRHSVMYAVAKELPNILQSLAEKSIHHVHIMQNFIESIKDITFQPREC